MPKAKKSSGVYQAQWYESRESSASPYAVAQDESLWVGDNPTLDRDYAIEIAKSWMTGGAYKTTRVVELDATTGNPTNIVWASAWEAPSVNNPEQGTSGIPGYACKLMIWMEREKGDPDHWGWRTRFRNILNENNNAWDLAYGRPVDNRGRKTLYSVKLNLWPSGDTPRPSQWNWHKILDKDPIVEAEDVEFVRAADIGPREFPAGAEINECVWCHKLHLKSATWMGYNPESEEMEPHCSCFCIDEHYDPDQYRVDPDGEEYEEPGCAQVRKGVTV